jgi:hypothetical protein
MNQAFGGGSSGTVGGRIGAELPAPSDVAARANEEAKRREAIAQRWRELDAQTPLDPKEYLERYRERKRLGEAFKYEQSNDPNDLRRWISTDQKFVRDAAPVLARLRSTVPVNDGQIDLQSAGEQAVALADESYAQRDTDAAAFYLSLGRAAADLLVGLDPVTGTLRAVSESITGVNLVTGERLTDFERGLAIFGVVTLGYAGEFSRGIALFNKVMMNLPREGAAVQAALRTASWIAKKFASFRGASAVEKSAPKFMRMLVEASAGPRLRAEALRGAALTVETIESGAMRINPELYKLENALVHNSSLGSASSAEIDAVGKAFVGEGAKTSNYPGFPGKRIHISQDGRRLFREPVYKPGLKKFQANLEVYAPPGSGRTSALSNAHIDLLTRDAP